MDDASARTSLETDRIEPMPETPIRDQESPAGAAAVRRRLAKLIVQVPCFNERESLPHSIPQLPRSVHEFSLRGRRLESAARSNLGTRCV